MLTNTEKIRTDHDACGTILSIQCRFIKCDILNWIQTPVCIWNTAHAIHASDNLKNNFQLVMWGVMTSHSVTRLPIWINLLFSLNWNIQTTSLVYFFCNAFLHSKALEMQWQQLMLMELIRQYVYMSSILTFNIVSTVYSIHSINNHANMLKVITTINIVTRNESSLHKVWAFRAMRSLWNFL